MTQTIEHAVFTHAMIDIETLSTDGNAFITSIGVVLFGSPGDPGHIHCMRVMNIDPWVDQSGSHICPDTIRWRQKQSEESKNPLRQPDTAYISLSDAIIKLRQILDYYKVENVWANSPEFDLTIINNAAERLGLPAVTKYWQHRDVRTAKNLLEVYKGSKVEYPVRHDPISDCVDQITFIVLPLYRIMHNERGIGTTSGAGGSSGN